MDGYTIQWTVQIGGREISHRVTAPTADDALVIYQRISGKALPEVERDPTPAELESVKVMIEQLGQMDKILAARGGVRFVEPEDVPHIRGNE